MAIETKKFAVKPLTIKVTNEENKMFILKFIAENKADTYDAVINLLCEKYRNPTNPGDQELIERLQLEIEEHIKKIEELNSQEPVLMEIEKPIPLTGTQFIMEPSEKTFTAMRKVRKFAKEDGLIPRDTTNEQYPSVITEEALRFYINEKLSDYV